MKIQIMGYSGSGKSTLAKQLGEFYKIPYLHMDNVHYYGNWQERTKEERKQIVNKFLAENENWIIEGNASDISPIRFEISDITIFLNYNRFYCYKKCKERYKIYKGRPRESCPCNDKFEWDFKKFILFGSRTKKRKRKYLNNLNKTKGQKLIFKNVKQLNAWLKEIGCIK